MADKMSLESIWEAMHEGKKVRLGGQDFVEIPIVYDGREGVGLTTAPSSRPDNMLEFPTNAPLEDDQLYLGSGIAAHKRALEYASEEGLRAIQLEISADDYWYGECFGVMMAHDWFDDQGNLAAHIVEHVVLHYGQEEIDRAKERYGDNWDYYGGELAAVRLAAPLSRLWYAANMMSLQFIHHDDMRLGYLWAEYRMRLRHEKDAFRGKKNVASARDGGVQRAKQSKPKSQQILDKMATYVKVGKSVANAAQLAKNFGFGRTAEANRKLWNRNHK